MIDTSRGARPRCRLSLALFALAAASTAAAQTPSAAPPSIVTVSATASATVANDRLQAWLRAEAEDANPGTAASQVNATTAKALARARGYPAVKIATSGYSTQQVSEKGKPARWRVAQTVMLDSADFTAAATLITKLQEEDGLLLSGMGFSLSDKVRRDAEDRLTEQAIKAWQSRAQQAAQALSFAGWRPGHVTVQTGDAGRVYPTMRSAAAGYAGAAPVAVEAGTSEVTVTVGGEAVLEQARR